MEQIITPKSLILSMLQASPNQAMPVKTLVSIGKLFGFTGNTIRVRTTRLLHEGTIESDERGLYRLSQKGVLMSRYIDRWKEGERRLKKWDGSWLCCMVPKEKGKRLLITTRAFGFFGFREGLPGLWVRPDNLSLGFDELTVLLFKIGRIEKGEMFVASRFSVKLTEQWQRFLWPIEKILRNQQLLMLKMEKSTARLGKMLLEDALLESYLLGSEAIQMLVLDPLLPDEMMDVGIRAKLTRMMLDYDKIGKKIWSTQFDQIHIDQSPAHLQLIAKAN